MLQVFNIPVISGANFTASLTLAVILLHARATRRIYPGFDDWVISQVVLAVGMVLVSLRVDLSAWVSLLLGNSLLMLAQVFVYTGCIRFFDLRGHRRWPYYGLLAVAVAGFAWLIATGGSAGQRSLLFSVFMVIMMGRIIVALMMHKSIRKDPSVLLFLVALLVSLLFFFARALILWHVGTENALWGQRLLAAAFFVGIVFSTLLVFGFLQLVQARTEGELQAAQSRAEKLAHTDRLTGAWNRRRFEHEARREMARSMRHGQPLSLIAFDVDHFKLINDHHGHPGGDAVLAGISKLVFQRIRGTDALFRWGGDEFLIMTPMTCTADAEALARDVCGHVAARGFGAIGKVTLSAGVAEYCPGETLDTWLARADRGIYAAKAQGRNRVVGLAASVNSPA